MADNVEILAPAGDMTCLQAALDARADAVYFGLSEFNMRQRAGINFTLEDLPEIKRRCEDARPGKVPVKRYLTLNSIIFEDELEKADALIAAAKPYVDAFIVADWGVVALCRKHGVEFHVSTQMSISNSAAVKFLKEQGATRVVLARECTLEEVRRIARDGGLEIECFVHGAQCVAESGRCLMSHDAYGCSASRGECRQPCRRTFVLKAVDLYSDGDGRPVHESDTEFTVTPHTVLSAKDLCSLPFIDKLMEAKVASFKIEGRARNPEYVMTVVGAYREAVDAVLAGKFTPELAAELVERTRRFFHREYSCGLYFGRPGAEQFTDGPNSFAKEVKRHCGVVIDYFLKAKIAQVKIQDAAIKIGDLVQIHGPTTGVQEFRIESLRRDDEIPEVAEKGTWVTFPAPRCRVGDKVFLICSTEHGGAA
jgi:putative protease